MVEPQPHPREAVSVTKQMRYDNNHDRYSTQPIEGRNPAAHAVRESVDGICIRNRAYAGGRHCSLVVRTCAEFAILQNCLSGLGNDRHIRASRGSVHIGRKTPIVRLLRPKDIGLLTGVESAQLRNWQTPLTFVSTDLTKCVAVSVGLPWTQVTLTLALSCFTRISSGPAIAGRDARSTCRKEPRRCRRTVR